MSGVIAENSCREKQASVASLESPVVLNPMEISDWDAQLARCPGASFFHGSAWARVLRDTYAYEPAYFGRFAGGQLKQLLPAMEVSGAWRGRRGVSLPFADNCAPLNTAQEDLSALYAFAMEHARKRNWSSFETRGCFAQWPEATPSVAFFNHVLHLEGGEAALADGLDGAMRRKLRKAEDEKVHVEFGGSREYMRVFHALYGEAQRRRGLPLQPMAFFENLVRHVLEAGRGFVAVARHGERPVAAAVFVHAGRGVICQFTASDREFQHLHASNLLMWEAARHCVACGFAELQLGRTPMLDDGLRHFKLGLGAFEEQLEYAKYDLRRAAFVKTAGPTESTLNNAFRCLPLPLLRLAGKFYAAF
jgi:CelD/BcsL family acetyltransferase involved in cellulose biosynthesis